MALTPTDPSTIMGQPVGTVVNGTVTTIDAILNSIRASVTN